MNIIQVYIWNRHFNFKTNGTRLKGFYHQIQIILTKSYTSMHVRTDLIKNANIFCKHAKKFEFIYISCMDVTCMQVMNEY